MVGVAVTAVAEDLPEDGGAAPFGGLPIFENQEGGSLAHHEPVASRVEGTGGRSRVVVAGAQGTHPGEGGHGHRSD